MSHGLKLTLKSWQTHWQTLAPREKVFLQGLAAFVLLAALGQGLWSAHAARQRLQQEVPQLRQQFETMQRQAGEIRQLQTQPAAPAAQEGAALLALAKTSAQTVGLAAVAEQMQLEGGRQLRVRATLSFDRWLEWLAAVQGNARLRLLQARVEAASENADGLVKVDALLALPESN